MAKEGVLTTKVAQSIQIEHFIFHIIIKGEDEPRILNRVELQPAQYEFFQQRIADASAGTQYRFQSNDAGVALRASRILENPRSHFHSESTGLAVDFHAQHRGNVNDGAFIVAHFSADVNGTREPMLALLKMDHRRVLEYRVRREHGERIAKMNEILNSFVEDKTAVQKCAIVDLGSAYTWDVLAFERRNQVGIADYFRAFLRVIESDTDSNLTRRAVTSVNTWARAHKHELPERPWKYRIRATEYLEQRDNFDTEEFLNVAIFDEDKDRKEEIKDSLREHLQESGVAGQQFNPRPNSIPTKEKTTKIQTAEGVNVSWSGSDDAAHVDISERDVNGMYTIRIQTQHYKES